MRSRTLAGAVAAGLVVAGDVAVRRSRRAGLDVIGAPTPADGAGYGAAGDGAADPAAGYGFLVAAGVNLTDAQRRAAAGHARRAGLDVLDLIPADLPAGRLRALLRRVDPAAYRRSPLEPGQGVYQALCVSADTLERAGLKGVDGLAPVELAELTVHLKRYAPTSSGLAVLAGLAAATADRPGARAADLAGWRAVLRLPPPGPSPAALAVKRDEYAADLAAGTDRFFEPPRTTCPWCGADRLAPRLRAADLGQSKPGTFRYDRCRACSHVFQNPRLSPAGLEFYYRDFYDGLGEARMEALFGAGAAPYRSRAGLVARSAAPRTWLDVGGGHGHFCLIARETWPGTRFDALDQGAGIEEAHRRGWADGIYRGEFPARAAELAGRYDVVSMFHYLEHVRDPFAELDAAREVVRPGGHLVIEVPNIESLSASLLGSAWAGWLVPQHQHMIPMDNLLAALAERSFTPVTASFGDSRPGGPAGLAVYFNLNRWFPDPTLPWRTAPHPEVRKAVRAVALTAAAPAMVLAAVADLVLQPLRRSGRRADVYRVVARRDG